MVRHLAREPAQPPLVLQAHLFAAMSKVNGALDELLANRPAELTGPRRILLGVWGLNSQGSKGLSYPGGT